MKITFLGTGTSQGVPLINCDCKVCKSKQKKNKRLRTSISIQTTRTTIIIDTTPDLRTQLLANPIQKLDAVLFTHAHADHIYGIDDLRRFNQLQKERIPVYAESDTLKRLTSVFNYAFGNGALRPGLPNLLDKLIEGPFKINELNIIPVDLMHGDDKIYGFRIGNFAYCTDVNKIPQESYHKLKNLKILVLDALREKTHPTHFSLEQAIGEAKKINAAKTYFVHMTHDIDHLKHSKQLPANIFFAYDGLSIEME